MPGEAILVVEDDAIATVDIQQTLEGLGYRVVGPAASGEEALTRFEAERADLVLMDIRLRGPMDGIEAAALLRDRFGVPVVYLTAYADQETLLRAGATAPFSYLVKPLQARDLHAAVEMAFHRHRIEAALRDANVEVEQRVAERTAELQETNERLQRAIAEHQRAEQEARQARARLERLVAASPAVIYTVQAARALGAAAFISSNVTAQLGYQPEDFTTDPGFWADCIHPEDRERILSGVQDQLARNRGYSLEYRFRAKDGGYRWMYDEARLTTDDAGAPESAGYWVDVTERKQAEDALRESSTLNQQIIASAQEGVVVYDRELRYRTFNPFMERLSGFLARDVLGQRAPDIFPFLREPGVIARIEKALAGETPGPIDFPYDLPDGTSGWAMDSTSPLRDWEGRVVGAIGIVQVITERKRSEEEIRRLNETLEARVAERTARLAEGETWLRAILTTVPEAVVTIESDGTVTSFNRAAERDFGYAAAEVVGRNVSMLMPSPYSEEHDGHLERYKRTGEAHVIGRVREVEGRRKDGTAFPLELCVGEMQYEAKHAFVATLRDITARKRAEDTLRRSEERFRMVVDHIQDALIIDDVPGRIVFANQRFADLVGYDLERVLQLTLEDYVAPEWRPALRDRHDRRVRGESVAQHFEYEALRADGKRLWFEVSAVAVIDESGAIIGTQAALRDVSERKRVQEALRSAASEWQISFDSVDVALVLIGGDGRILRLNEPARRLSGEAYPELLGRDLREVRPIELWREAAELALRPADAQTPRATRICDEGRGQTWDVRVSEVADPDPQRPRRLIVAATDVTETVRLEKALRRSETMAVVGSLASGVAHEVRGPLFALSANLDALEASDAAPAERLKPLRRSVVRLNTLIEDLLDFARPSTSRLAKGSFAGPIREAQEDCLALAERGGVSIVSAPDSASGHVLLDRERLRQVFTNIVQNAIHHSPRNETVRIEFESLLESGREWVRCLVSDHGPGFREEDLERAFEPFFTRRKGGTGLGLAIAKRIVADHHGRIEARNRLEGGACVIVALPLADE